MHRATGRLTVSGKGSAFDAGRAEDGASRAPRFQTEFYCVLAMCGAQRTWRFAVNPERPKGFGGKTVISLSSRWLSEISIAIA